MTVTFAGESVPHFEHPDLMFALNEMGAGAFDDLAFGVIHFDSDLIVRRYNRYEQLQAGLNLEKVLGKHVFTELAQCMNNFMVAEKFVEAKASGQRLDSTIDYVLTWKMKPTPIKLRMLSDAAYPGGYIVIQRLKQSD